MSAELVVAQLTALPRHVESDLARLVESEELGSSFFGTAANLARADQSRASWKALHDLEFQTRAGVADFLKRSALQLQPTNTLARGTGSSGGTGLQLLPYRLQLRMIRLGTKRYLPAFHRLACHYQRTEEAEFFEYVVQHELAIIEFTQNALADARAPLDPVRRLLDQGVPGLNSESCYP